VLQHPCPANRPRLVIAARYGYLMVRHPGCTSGVAIFLGGFLNPLPRTAAAWRAVTSTGASRYE
ncbi:MAG: hypothetical protein AAF223_10415, partial [Bacteroidota bacterium]